MWYSLVLLFYMTEADNRTQVSIDNYPIYLTVDFKNGTGKLPTGKQDVDLSNDTLGLT